MGQSLQEQLVAAGLATRKQARKARRDTAGGRRKPAPDGQQQASQAVAMADAGKRAADRRRAQAANAERERRERKRQALQIIHANRLAVEAPDEDEPPYNYTIKGRIRRLPVSRGQRRRLADGRLAIVRYDGETSLIDAATAARLQQLIPKAVFRNSANDDAPDPDDPYAGYEVPDDLMW